MTQENQDETLAQRLGAVAVDLITSLFCVSLWMTFWSCLDRLEVPEITTGVLAGLVGIFLSTADAHRHLERLSESWSTTVTAVAVFAWTAFLAILSINIWRASFALVHWRLLPHENDKRAVLISLLGVLVLVASGRMRTTCDATPIGFVVDGRYHGERFATPSYLVGTSLHRSVGALSRLSGAILDLVLTLPVVFVWAGVWMYFDNHKVDAWLSFAMAAAFVSLLGAFRVEQKLAAMFCNDSDGHGHHVVIGAVEALWTMALAILCIAVWRGLWEGLSPPLQMAAHPMHRALVDGDAMVAGALSLLAAIALAALGRFRSSLFPPMDFSEDGVFSPAQKASVRTGTTCSERSLSQSSADYGSA